MMRRLLALASAALMTVVGLSLTTASAASLGITTPPETFLMQESACAPAMHNASPVIDATPGGTATGTSYSRVSLSDIPASCQNLPLDVFVHGSQGALVASAAVPGGAQSSTITVNVGNYPAPDVTGVVLRIDGWLFLTEWTPPAPPVVPAYSCVPLAANGAPTSGTCTVTSVRFGETWGEPGHRISNVYIGVTSSAARSRITLNLASPPFPGWANGTITSLGNFTWGPASSCATPGVYTLDSPSWSGEYYVQIGQHRGLGGVCSP